MPRWQSDLDFTGPAIPRVVPGIVPGLGEDPRNMILLLNCHLVMSLWPCSPSFCFCQLICFHHSRSILETYVLKSLPLLMKRTAVEAYTFPLRLFIFSSLPSPALAVGLLYFHRETKCSSFIKNYCICYSEGRRTQSF